MFWLGIYFIDGSLVVLGDGEWRFDGDSVLVLFVFGDFTSNGVYAPCFVGFVVATILVINMYISC